MRQVFSSQFESTLCQLTKKYANSNYRGYYIEAWVFGDLESRLAAEKVFFSNGVKAKFRCSYKPLVHFFLEDSRVIKHHTDSIEVTYPLHKSASPSRFLLEAYPLTALLDDQTVTFSPNSNTNDHYQVTYRLKTGERVTSQVFAPNRIGKSMTGETVLSPTGWLKITTPEGKTIKSEQLTTDYENLFTYTLAAIDAFNWPTSPPYFEELNLSVTLPWQDKTLPYKHERVSFCETLHEDFYFSLQEWTKKMAGKKPDDREVRIGQIVPEVRYMAGDFLSVTVEDRPYLKQHECAKSQEQEQELKQAKSPLSIPQIEKELLKVTGAEITAFSITGHKITARYQIGSDKPVMISAGQHANETTGVVGALRAAHKLTKQAKSHFTISPLENPDGYALHQRLIRQNPYHMHHAARYTALGDDFEYRSHNPLYEKNIRHKAQSLSKANLHINLHGYPSHEWTRPLSGYVPQSFENWTLPKGFFLILRHCATTAWTAYAERFINLVTQQLSTIPKLIEFNQQQLTFYKTYVEEKEFRVINQIPCLIVPCETTDMPLQLITEYPDETIHDQYFIDGHDIQEAAVLIAYDAYQQLPLPLL